MNFGEPIDKHITNVLLICFMNSIQISAPLLKQKMHTSIDIDGHQLRATVMLRLKWLQRRNNILHWKLATIALGARYGTPVCNSAPNKTIETWYLVISKNFYV